MDFMSYQDTLKPDDFAKQNIQIFLYRWGNNAEKVYVAKCFEPVNEDLIQRVHGGGTYRLLMKNGPQLIKSIDKMYIEGPAIPLQKIPPAGASPSAANGHGDSAS